MRKQFTLIVVLSLLLAPIHEKDAKAVAPLLPAAYWALSQAMRIAGMYTTRAIVKHALRPGGLSRLARLLRCQPRFALSKAGQAAAEAEGAKQIVPSSMESVKWVIAKMNACGYRNSEMVLYIESCNLYVKSMQGLMAELESGRQELSLQNRSVADFRARRAAMLQWEERMRKNQKLFRGVGDIANAYGNSEAQRVTVDESAHQCVLNTDEKGKALAQNRPSPACAYAEEAFKENFNTVTTCASNFQREEREWQGEALKKSAMGVLSQKGSVSAADLQEAKKKIEALHGLLFENQSRMQ